jgi:MFS family permease
MVLLVLMNLFNYLDRSVLAAVEEDIRKQLFPDVLDEATGKMTEPRTAKELMGWLNSAFYVSFMIFTPIFATMASSMPRWRLLAIGIAVWSLASGATGASYLLGTGSTAALQLGGYVLSLAYLAMLLTRCFVGVGEAAFGPIAPALIADMYPEERRGRMISIFYTAIPFGGAMGYTVGEVLTRVAGHWSWAFYVVVIPGLLLGVWCLFMPEPARSGGEGPPRPRSLADYAEVFSIRSFALNCAGMTCMCFAMAGLAYWAPTFLRHRGAEEVLGILPKTFFGLMTAVLGLAATILGGLAADWLKRWSSGAYFLASGGMMVVGAPLLVASVYLPFPLAWLPLAGFVFCIFFNIGPTNTIIANVTPPDLRVRAFAINILVINLVGTVLSSPVLGRIIGSEDRFDLAFLTVSAVVLAGGLLWIWGAAYLRQDTERASARAGEMAA